MGDWIMPPRSRSRPRQAPRNYQPPFGDRGDAFPSLFGSNSLQEQYLKSSSVATIATWLQNLVSGGSPASPGPSVYGRTLQGFNYEPPTQPMKMFEQASGLKGAAEIAAKSAGNRAIPNPLLWILTPSLMKMFRDASGPAPTS